MKILREYEKNFKPYVVAADNTPNGYDKYDKYDDISLLAWNIILYGNKSDGDLIRRERDDFRNYVIFQYFQKLADIIFHFHRNENHDYTYTQDDITDIAKIITGYKKALTDVSVKFETERLDTDRLDTDRLATKLILQKTKKMLEVFDDIERPEKIQIILKDFSKNAEDAKAQTTAKAVEATSLTDRIKKSVAFFTGKPR